MPLFTPPDDAELPRDTVRSVPMPGGLFMLVGYDVEGEPVLTVLAEQPAATHELARDILRAVRRDYRRRHPAVRRNDDGDDGRLTLL